MERLTYFKDGYWRVNFSGVQYQADFVDRLAAYEDIAELCGGFDRLRELAEADKDGRVVILPCKAGDMLYEITTRKTISEYRATAICVTLGGIFIEWEIRKGFAGRSASGITPSAIGKTVFLTREEAEKALQEMEGKKDG